jgi:hypothetical protein
VVSHWLWFADFINVVHGLAQLGRISFQAALFMKQT